MMARAVTEAARAGLAGFEWGIGVPGTLGGSVRGNAGCFGGEMRQVVEKIQLLEFPISLPSADLPQGDNFSASGRSPAGRQFPNNIQIPNSKFQIREISKDDCQFNYRDSIFKRHPEWIILSATLKLFKGNPQEIQDTIRRITTERVKKQDIGTKTCGCIFKNVSWERSDIKKTDLLRRFQEFEQFKEGIGIPASFLIDKAGLKGARTAHCSISDRHANFFVNEGGATADEVRDLIQIAKEKVCDTFGIQLEEEIQYIGFEE
jgi:UDP-N-acetylmuramate dehydrogenase